MNRLFTDYQLAIITFCANECRRHNSGELSVAGMVAAWEYAVQHYSVVQEITEDDIAAMAKLIDPDRNSRGYRQAPMHFGDFVVLKPEDVSKNVAALIADPRAVTPSEFYLRYRGLHPHTGGNALLGSLLFNVLNGTLYCPEEPPRFDKKAIFVSLVAVPQS